MDGSLARGFPPVGAPRTRRRGWQQFARRHNLNTDILFVLPALGVYLFYVAYPLVRVFVDSLYDWDGLRTPIWIGLGNYAELFTRDQIFLGSVRNNLYWALATIGIQLVLGFALAYLLNQRLRLGYLYRTLIFLPVTAGGIVVALAWNQIYSPNIGLLNGTLRALGLDGLTRAWLGDPNLALWAIILTSIWHSTGSWMVIYLAGLQSIPVELFEAAMIDGASSFQRMRHVALPLVRGMTSALAILGAIGAVQTFGLVYLMTRGGPYHATEVMALRIYDLAFKTGRAGYAAAVSVVLILISAAITAVQLLRYRAASQED